MEDLFTDADLFIEHAERIASNTGDDFLTSRYVGFIAVSAVTVYEVAVKKLFVEFARSQNPILANFVSAEFARISARIRLDDLKDKYLKKFGENYKNGFNELLKMREEEFLKESGASIINSYTNLIVWRHEFVHEGTIPNSATFVEAVESYKLGKEVISVLNRVLNPDCQ